MINHAFSLVIPAKASMHLPNISLNSRFSEDDEVGVLLRYILTISKAIFTLLRTTTFKQGYK